MEVKFVEKEKMKLVGKAYYGPLQGEGWSHSNSIGQTWQRFIDFCEDKEKWKLIEKHAVNPHTHYEVHIWKEEEFQKTGDFEVFVGMEVECLDKISLELDSKVLPATTYALLNAKGQEIKTWEGQLEDVLPKSKYPQAKFDDYQFLIQCYDDRFKGLDKMDESEMDILIPIEKVVNE